MLSEDQFMERTPDLVARIRKMREEAEVKMNRFTRVTDYDVRHVAGHCPKAAQAPSGAVAGDRSNESAAASTTNQSSIGNTPTGAAQDHERGPS